MNEQERAEHQKYCTNPNCQLGDPPNWTGAYVAAGLVLILLSLLIIPPLTDI